MAKFDVPALLQSVRAIWAAEPGSARVARARVEALQTQLPLLFVMLATNVIALATTHAGRSPALLTFGFPSVMLPVLVARLLHWRRLDIDKLSDALITKTLRKSLFVAVLLGLSMVCWALMLMPYSGINARAHIAFFIAVTCIGCLIGLLHLRYGAVLVACAMALPTVCVFLATGSRSFAVIAANYVVVNAVICVIALSHYRAFHRLVEATEKLGAMSEANRRLADVDSLTDLANRRSFLIEVQKKIEAARSASDSFVVGLVDLDGFKAINDFYGHQVGDRVLAEVGRRLRISLDEGWSAARLGGDEFAFLVASATDSREIETIGRRICETIGRPFDIGPVHMRVGASIGMAKFPENAGSADQLLERADIALYHAKERVRGGAIMFIDAHERRVRERGRLEHELRLADLERELHLVFQPIVDTRRGRVISFEALARWQSTHLGAVPPLDFIEAAERIGLIRDITEILFRKACKAAADWPDTIRLAFNLSTADLAGDGATDRLCGLVRDSGLAPKRFTFEITETSVMRDFAHSVQVLQALRDLGCRIALDDFGTGFSSLSYVHRLPLDKLKVDQSFVRSVATDGVSFAIVRTIVDLCANLDISCVIEGVETQAQADLLASIGCTVMQGYLFGKPMPASVIAAGGTSPWSRRMRSALPEHERPRVRQPG